MTWYLVKHRDNFTLLYLAVTDQNYVHEKLKRW